MNKRESVYAQKLKDLGFRKVEGRDGKTALGEIEQDVLQVIGKRSRAERRKLRRELRTIMSGHASFIVNMTGQHPITEASDDTGQLWEAEGEIDLKPFGFTNNAEWLLEHLGVKNTRLNS